MRELIQRGHALSYTQWEAWLALYHGKLLVIAEADQAAPRGPKYAPTDASRAAQREHVQRLRGFERYSSTFSSPDNLAKFVLSSAILDLLTRAQHAEAFGLFRKFPYPSLIAVLFLLLLTPLAADQLAKTLGVSLAAPISLIGAAGGLALALMCWRYLGILGSGAAAPGSLERRAYDALRESLATDGIAVRLYSRWLTALLDAVDRFFGDAGMADRTLFPRAFGLRTPASLWTAPAFDRCLLLALIYPIVTIFIMWAVSGHVGPAEQALSITPNLLAWQRGLVMTIAGFAAFLLLRYVRTKGWKSLIWVAATIVAACAAVAAGAAAGVVDWKSVEALLIISALTSAAAFTAAGAVAGAAALGVPGPAARSVAFNVAGAVPLAFVFIFTLFGFAGAPNGFDGALAVPIAIAGAVAGSGTAAVAVAVTVAMLPLAASSVFPYLVITSSGPVAIAS